MGLNLLIAIIYLLILKEHRSHEMVFAFEFLATIIYLLFLYFYFKKHL
jgi:hypothetical protein